MPVLDGRGFCEELRRRPEFASIPIIVVSARIDSAKHAAELGAYGCLGKPMKVADLLSMTGKLCTC